MATEDNPVSRRGFLRAAGAGAAVAGGVAGNAAAGGGGGGGGTVTVDVVNYAYRPGTDKPLYVKPGTTVKWVWKSDGHNIIVDQKPDGSSWEGVSALKNTGFTHTHTFETKGKYHYFCEPHKSMGMVADLEVTDNPPKQGGYESILPDSAKAIGVAGTAAMTGVLGLSYVFMRYGGDYGEDGDFERGEE